MTNPDMLKKYQEHCEKTLDKFKRKVGVVPAIENGMFVFEAFSLCVIADMLGADSIIESGVAGGRSTEMWARFFDGTVYAIDNTRYYGRARFLETKERLKNYNNIVFIEGDAYKEILPILKNNREKKYVISLDGPKGLSAISLAARCCLEKNAVGLAIHDQAKEANFQQMNIWRNDVFYSSDSWFIEKYSFLEQLAAREFQLNPIGYGLGIVMSKHADGVNCFYTRWKRLYYYNLYKTYLRDFIAV